MPRNRIDLTGNVYNMLTVLSLSHYDKGHSMWNCLCQCGNTTIARGHSLKSGRLHSCGCYNSKAKVTHGMSSSKEYKTWNRLKDRCLNSNNKNYKDYGGRGITLCSTWVDSFEQFYNDVGKCPNINYSLDRIDNDKGYYKDNVRWVEIKVQANNRRTTKNITYMNKTQSLSEWADELNAPRDRLYQRIYKLGWTVEEAFTLPPDLANKYIRGNNNV